jgi:hypothetical protein
MASPLIVRSGGEAGLQWTRHPRMAAPEPYACQVHFSRVGKFGSLPYISSLTRTILAAAHMEAYAPAVPRAIDTHTCVRYPAAGGGR